MNPNVSKLKRQIGQRILQARNEAGILTNVELAAAIEREMTEYEFSISEACVRLQSSFSLFSETHIGRDRFSFRQTTRRFLHP